MFGRRVVEWLTIKHLQCYQPACLQKQIVRSPTQIESLTQFYVRSRGFCLTIKLFVFFNSIFIFISILLLFFFVRDI